MSKTRRLTYSEVIKRIEDLPDSEDKYRAFKAVGIKLIECADNKLNISVRSEYWNNVVKDGRPEIGNKLMELEALSDKELIERARELADRLEN